MNQKKEQQTKIGGVIFLLAGGLEIANIILQMARGKNYISELIFALIFTIGGIALIFKKS